MGKLIHSGNWKPVEIKGANFSDLDGLAGFEELTDYELSSNLNKSSKLKTKAKSLKTKVSKKNSKKTSKKQKSVNSAIAVKHVKPANKFTVEPSTKLLQENDEVDVPSDAEVTNDSITIAEELPWSNIFVTSEISKALLENNFTGPTPIQAACIPPAIKGRRDILGAAETGSGKTLAFGIPMLQGIMLNLMNNTADANGNADNDDDNDDDDDTEELDGPEPTVENYSSTNIGCVQVIDYGPVASDKNQSVNGNNKLWGLVLTPTRELALQVKNHLVSAAKYTGIKVAVIVGGMSTEKQRRILKLRPHIVVATPGRLWELITCREEHFSDIASIRFLAIDEADRMTEVNHFPELRSLLERLNANPELKKKRQNFVFSATLSLVHEPPGRLKNRSKKSMKRKKPAQLTPGQKLQQFIDVLGITNPKVVDMTTKSVVTDNLTETCIYCSFENKDLYLYYFLQRHPGRTLVFCNNISCVRRLASLLNVLKCQPLPLHANMMQRQRLKNLDRFRDNPCGVLLATDVAARGLDIPSVKHVIHYQVPKTSESYVHRSGRTARGNEQGLTLLLIEPLEMDMYRKLCRTLNKEQELPEFPVDPSLMSTVRERVHLARDIDRIEFVTKKQNSNIGWLEKAAEDMDIIIDDNLMPEKMDLETSSKIKHVTNVKRKKLDLMLSKRLVPLSSAISAFSRNTPSTLKESSESAIEIVKSSKELPSKKKNKNKLF